LQSYDGEQLFPFSSKAKKGNIMKKLLTCAELGVPTCTFEARSEKPDEIKDAIFTHFVKFHPDKAAKATDADKANLMRTMDQKLR
jgi:predicted small metal-binding protein